MTHRRLLAPEVVQTSTMDCGPAALKCLLEGHGVPVSYGRLREACQTDVDGTSIDTIEVVAQQLGLDAEQSMLPVDHVLLGAAALPAIVVVRHADAATHFVVVWRRVAGWLQVMDPALGRRWVRAGAFRDEVFRHTAVVDTTAWCDWAGSAECLDALALRLAALGVRGAPAQALVTEALAPGGWAPRAALDAAVRLVQSMADAGGVAAGAEAQALVSALARRAAAADAEALRAIPASFWSATAADAAGTTLHLHGAVVLRVAGRRAADEHDSALPPRSVELDEALRERPVPLPALLWQLLRQGGRGAPFALAAAVVVAAGAVTVEALLLRGLLDVSAQLGTAAQRLGAVAALGVFLLALAAIELPIGLEVLRQGRQLETRLRIALLRKLPRLNDRYFQSRPLSDMADRSHGLQLLRGVPGLVYGLLQALCELALTLAAVIVISPASAPLALLLAACALAVPLFAQPLLNERDLRARNHAGALNGFYLDALLGLVPVRAHRAEANVSRQHESLLVDWARAARSGLRATLWAEGVQGLIGLGLAGALLVQHFAAAGEGGGVGGSGLLLVFWTLKLPALGNRLAGLAQQLPAQRNVLLRLTEPLNAPEEPAAPEAAFARDGAIALQIEGGSVLAGGHEILREVELTVRPGEHVAIVGPSGAGKSSLLGLLLGWHRLADGTLRIDGQPCAGAQIEALRRMTAWVDPGVQVWNRSLTDNLAYASDVDDPARTAAAIETARLGGVLARLPDGLQSLLGEGGALLSGGEGQRVRLGRALAATGTRLALLDEPFRGLDRAQRRALMAEARQWWRGTTLLCVTHDVGETQAFDRVLVVEGGRIVEDGAPAQLLAAPSRYRDLLDAETRVHERLWQGAPWRRLTVRDGGVHATATHEVAA